MSWSIWSHLFSTNTEQRKEMSTYSDSGTVGRKIFWSSPSKNILNLEIFNAWTSRTETVRIGFMLISVICVIFSESLIHFQYLSSAPIRGGDLTLNYSRVIVLNLNLIDTGPPLLGEDTSAHLQRGQLWLGLLRVYLYIVQRSNNSQICEPHTGSNNPTRGLSCTITGCEVRGEMGDIGYHTITNTITTFRTSTTLPSSHQSVLLLYLAVWPSHALTRITTDVFSL